MNSLPGLEAAKNEKSPDDITMNSAPTLNPTSPHGRAPNQGHRKGEDRRKQDRLRRALQAVDKIPGHNTLWAHQSLTLQRLAKHYRRYRPHPNAIAVIPTAGGKTEIFGRLVVAHAKCRHIDTRPSIILVPTRNLITQTIRRLHSLGLTSVQRGWKPENGRNPDTVVMSYSSFALHVHAGTLTTDDVDLIVLDEAHCGLSNMRKPALNTFEGQCPIIAFSATPAYDLIKSVYDLLGRDNEVIEVTPAELREAGIIAPAINYVIGVSITGDLPQDPKQAMALMRQGAREALYEFHRTHVERDLALQANEKLFIGYHASHADADLFTTLFNTTTPAGTLPCRTITGLDQSAQQDFLIDALRQGNISGLNNAMLLIEGSDIPTVGAILNFAPTQSLVREVQRCGRAMRLDTRYAPRDPRQLSIVVDVFWEINGVIAGRPRFYFEAIGDNTIARFVQANGRTVQSLKTGLKTAIDIQRKGAVRPRKGEHPTPALPGRISPAPQPAGFTISHDIRDIQYLINRREGTSGSPAFDHWLTPQDILASFRHFNPDQASKVFAEFERKVGKLAPGLVHSVGRQQIRCGTKLKRGEAGVVFDPAQRLLFAPLIDATTRAMTSEWVTRDTIIGLSPNDKGVAAFFDTLEQTCLVQRRQQGTIAQRLTPDTIAPGLGFDLRHTPSGNKIAYQVKDTNRLRILSGLDKPGVLRTPDWITVEDLSSHCEPDVERSLRPRIRYLMTNYDRDVKDDGILYADDHGCTIRLTRTNFPTIGENILPAIHRDDLEIWITRDHRGIDDTEHWLTQCQVLEILGYRSYTKKFRTMWKHIVNMTTSAKADASNDSDIRAMKRRTINGRWTVQIHKDDVPLIRRKFPDVVARYAASENWMTHSEIERYALENGLEKAFAQERKTLKGRIKKENEPVVVTLSGHPIRLIRRNHRRLDTILIDRADIESFTDHVRTVEREDINDGPWFSLREVKDLLQRKRRRQFTELAKSIKASLIQGVDPIVSGQRIRYKIDTGNTDSYRFKVSLSAVQAIARDLGLPEPSADTRPALKKPVERPEDPDWIYRGEILRTLPTGIDRVKARGTLSLLAKAIAETPHPPGSVLCQTIGSQTITVRKREIVRQGAASHAFKRDEIAALWAYLSETRERKRPGKPGGSPWIVLSRAWRGMRPSLDGAKAGKALVMALMPKLRENSELSYPLDEDTIIIRARKTAGRALDLYAVEDDVAKLRTHLISLNHIYPPLPDDRRTKTQIYKDRGRYNANVINEIWDGLRSAFDDGNPLQMNGDPVEAGYYSNGKFPKIFAVDLKTAEKIFMACRRR